MDAARAAVAARQAASEAQVRAAQQAAIAAVPLPDEWNDLSCHDRLVRAWVNKARLNEADPNRPMGVTTVDEMRWWRLLSECPDVAQRPTYRELDDAEREDRAKRGVASLY